MKMYLVKCILGGLLFLHATSGSAQSMTPKIWADIDIEVRRLTNEGMTRRYQLLLDGAGLEEQAKDDAVTQHSILSVYQRYNTTAIKHLTYAQKKRSLLSSWLTVNEDVKAQRESLQREFEDELTRLSSLQNTFATGE